MLTPEGSLESVAADTPVIPAEAGINNLIQAMRKRRILRMGKTAHNVPCILREDAEGPIIHPVLGAGGKGYADLRHSAESITIRGSRTPGPGHAWNLRNRRAARDSLRVTFSVYHDEGPRRRIGSFVYKPEGETWAEVNEALEARSVGYVALHADLSAARPDGSREIGLFGEPTDDTVALQELPLTDPAATVLMGQANFALQKSLNPRY
jgi:hypothetical protein